MWFNIEFNNKAQMLKVYSNIYELVMFMLYPIVGSQQWSLLHHLQ
jgi:hypothetical protein